MLIFIISALFVMGQANASPFYDDPFGGKHLIETSVDKLTAYVNEQVTYTFSYYYTVISPSEPQKTLPSFAGFGKKEQLRLNPYWKNIGSERYRVEEVKVALFPITAGKIRIEPAILNLPESEKKLTTKPITLTILPLPEIGKPEGFTGTVGSFHLTAHIDKPKGIVEVGQSITLTVNIDGEGDIDSLPEPEIPELPGFTKYEPKISKRFVENTYEIRGEKIYEYVFVPTITGQWQFSPIQLPYFEPSSKTYQITRAQPIEIHVIPGASSGKNIDSPVQRDIRGGRDIQHIKPANVNLFDQSPYLYQRYYFWILQLLPVLAIAGAFIYKKRRKQQQSDINMQQRKISQDAEVHLEQSKTLMSPGRSQEFFDTLTKILHQYISEMFASLTDAKGLRLNISPVGLTTASISSLLTQKGIPEITRSKLVEVLQQCDYGRFAPATLTLEEMQQALNAAKEVIEGLAIKR